MTRSSKENSKILGNEGMVEKMCFERSSQFVLVFITVQHC